MKEEVRKSYSVIDAVRSYVGNAVSSRREKSATWVLDFCTVVVSFVFARCPLLFGTYPLALGWICALPSRVICAMTGAVLGALTLGSAGLPYALVYGIAVGVRLVLGGTENGEGTPVLFGEKLSLKLCVSILSGFILGIYEILLVGGAFSSILYAAGCVVFPGIACVLYQGLFLFPTLSPEAFFIGGKVVFSGYRRRVGERRKLVVFQGALLFAVFSFGVALRDVSFFGIGFSYLFATFAVLFCAKRFGAIRAMATGFAILIAVEPIHAVAYAIAGGVSALLFSVGIPYGLIGGGISLGLWSFYSGGVKTLLATFPEFAVGASLMLPLLKMMKREEVLPGDVFSVNEAKEMVGTMALSLKGKNDGTLALEEALSALSEVLKKTDFTKKALFPNGLCEALQTEGIRLCQTCEMKDVCSGFRKETFTRATGKVARGKLLNADDFSECAMKNDTTGAFLGVTYKFFANSISTVTGKGQGVPAAEICDALSKMIAEVRGAASHDFELDKPSSERLEKAFLECGFPSGVVRVFGEGKKTVLCATEEADSAKMTPEEIKNIFESTLGLRFSTPEFFKKDSMILLKCETVNKFDVVCASASSQMAESEVSGDVCNTFETESGDFYAVISDGMGTGETARQTAEFSVSYLKRILTTDCSKTTALSLLNRLLRYGTDECSSTVDLFEFDLKTGEGQFYKCGASPSYLKRGSSIFRIRSGTVPIGVLKNVDAERIRVDVLPGDTVVMCSDGVSVSPEDSPWLIELLAKPIPDDLHAFAKTVLDHAEKMNGKKDDMTVTVLKILEKKK